MFDHFTIFCNGYRFLAIFHHFFGHNFFAVDKFGGCGAGSKISSTPGATEGCTGEIGEPRAWMHSKMVIKQRRMETKPHGDSEMEEWRVSDWMVNAPLGYIPGATGISRSIASLPSTLHASSTAEIMWNAQAAWMPNPRNLSKNLPPSSFFPHAVVSKSIQ